MITGYGFGALGQGASYYFISSYFVVFLTNCVGFSSSTAGTISSLAMVVEVIAGMSWGISLTDVLQRWKTQALYDGCGSGNDACLCSAVQIYTDASRTEDSVLSDFGSCFQDSVFYQ